MSIDFLTAVTIIICAGIVVGGALEWRKIASWEAAAKADAERLWADIASEWTGSEHAVEAEVERVDSKVVANADSVVKSVDDLKAKL